MLKLLVVFGVGIACSLPVTSQETPSARVGVSVFKVKPGMMGRWMDFSTRYYMPAMDLLMEQGAVLGYGVATDILHRGPAPNVTVWYAAPNYEALQKIDEAITRVPGEHPTEARAFLETQDMEMHSDHVMHALEGGGKPAPAGAMPYTYINLMKVRDVQDEAFLKAFDKRWKPTLDQLVTDGAIYSWSLYEEEMHSEDPSYRWLVVDMSDLGAIDKAIAATNAAEEKQSPKEREADQAESQRVEDFSAHLDYIQRSLVYKTK